MDFKDERVKVRNVIAKDDVALEKWNTVKDSLVKNPADRLRLSRMIKRDEYHEAILLTIQLWCSDQGNPDWEQFINVMRDNGLNKLAGELGSMLLQTGKATGCIWFGMNEVPDNFTGRLTDMETLHDLMLKSRDEGPGVSQFVAVTGLGGIGKSTLCTKYAYDYKELYQNVIWIHAETFDSMRTSFQSLGNHLGITRSQELSIQDLVMAVHKHLSNKLCLFVFDNLENLRVLDPFRPKVNPWSIQPFVLITSRTFNVVRVSMHLNTLTEEEAISFVLADVNNSTQCDAIELVQLLECLPLALQQAVAYIREKFYESGEPTAIQKYMSQFKTSAAKLLNDEQFKDRLVGYEKTTYTTWTVTLDHIQQKSQSAVNLLQVLSYLNPDLISIKFMRRFMKKDPLEDALMVLRKYSMISLENKMVRVHRLVQRVVGLGLGDDRNTKFVSIIVQVVEDELEGPDFTDIIKESASHGVHLAKYQNMNSMSTRYLDNLCWFLGRYDNIDSLALCSKAVQHFMSLSGPNHLDTLVMRYRLGLAHLQSGNTTVALSILENTQQLAIANTEIGKEHPLTIAIQESIALTYFETDPPKMLKLCVHLMPTMVKLFKNETGNLNARTHNKTYAIAKLGNLGASLTMFKLLNEVCHFR